MSVSNLVNMVLSVVRHVTLCCSLCFLCLYLSLNSLYNAKNKWKYNRLVLCSNVRFVVKVSTEKKYTVTQHTKTNKHKRLLASQNKPAENKQQFTSQLSNEKSVFSHDLCNAMMCANIPLHKLSNIQCRLFLEKYILNDILH